MSEGRTDLRVTSSAEHRVQQGAQLLDAAKPGWSATITRPIEHAWSVLEQTFGTDETTWPVQKIEDAVTFGFAGHTDADSLALQAEWTKAVALRNAEVTPVNDLHVMGFGALVIINGTVDGRTALAVPKLTETEITFNILQWFDNQQEAMEVAAAIRVAENEGTNGSD